MVLNTTTNLNLKVKAKTKNINTFAVSGTAIQQDFKTKYKKLNYGNSPVNGLITKSYTSNSSLSRTDTGTVNEITTYTIDAIVPYNKSVKIATIVVSNKTAAYKFTNKLNSTLTKDIEGLSVSIKETDTVNTYDLICKTEREIPKSEDVIVDVTIPIVKSPVVSTNTIRKIYPGSLTIPLAGCERKIKLYGSPNTPFEISTLNASDTSITTDANAFSILPSGEKGVFSSKLNNKGYYTYKQKFPKVPVILKTAVNVGGGVTNAKQITFDSLTGVQVGDEILVTDTNNRRINSGETIKVVSIDSTYVCTLSKKLTLADNKKVAFRRSTSYKLNLETTGTKDSKITSTYPTYALTQNIGSIVTFNFTTTDGTVQINGESAGATHTVSFGNRKEKSRLVGLTVALTSRTCTNKTSSGPRPSNFITASGDAVVNTTVRSTGSGTSSYKLIIDMDLKFNTLDTIVNVNLDNIVNYS